MAVQPGEGSHDGFGHCLKSSQSVALEKEVDRMLEALESVFWKTVLSHVPHLHLPRGSESPCSSVSIILLPNI
jgi:hypothetical protein